MKPIQTNTKDIESEDRAKHNHIKVDSYPVQVSLLSKDEGGGFQALFPPLARSVVGYGATVQEAIADLQVMVPTFLKMLVKSDQMLSDIAIAIRTQ